MADDAFLLSEFQIKVDDARRSFFEMCKKVAAENVHSAEGHFLVAFVDFVYPFVAFFGFVFPSDELMVLVEEELARGLPILCQKPSIVF